VIAKDEQDQRAGRVGRLLLAYGEGALVRLHKPTKPSSGPLVDPWERVDADNGHEPGGNRRGT